MTVPVVRFIVAGQSSPAATGQLFAATPPAYTHTVVYDGHCRICRRLAARLHAWDRAHRFEIVPSQQPGVRARFPWIPPRAFESALQLVARNGRTFQGAAAIEEIVRLLPKGKLASWIFRIPLARGAADRAYRWFARHRRQLGCGSHCAYRPQETDFPA